MQLRSTSRKAAEQLAREFAGDDREVKVTIRIPESVRAQLKLIAANGRTNVQALIVEALHAAHPELT